MFTPEKVQSASEMFQAMASQAPHTSHAGKHPLTRPHNLVRKIRFFANGRQSEQVRITGITRSIQGPPPKTGETEKRIITIMKSKIHPAQKRTRSCAPVSLCSSPLSTSILQEPMEKIKMLTCKYSTGNNSL